MFFWETIKLLFSQAPHPLAQRNHQLFKSFDPSQTIESYDFVVFDTELTGLDTSHDEIVSIAAVRIKSMQILVDQSFHSLLCAGKKQVGQGTFVHKITPEQIKCAPDPKDVLPRFFDYCGSSVLVGHLPELDFSFLDKKCAKVMGGSIHNPCLDSMALAKTLWKKHERLKDKRFPEIDSFNLVELSKVCAIPLFPSHSALGDALQTACLFLFLVERLKELGMKSFRDFYKAGGVR